MLYAPSPTPTPVVVVNVPAPVVNVTPVVQVPPTVVNVPDNGSPVSALTFVIGVVTIILAQAVVQLWLVPRAERTKRADDRWEKNLHELIDLLSASVAVRGEAQRAGWSLLYLLEGQEQYEADWVKEETRTRRERLRTAEGEWAAVSDRVKWLAEMIYSRAPTRLVDFHVRALRASVYDNRNTGVGYVAETAMEATQHLATWDDNWKRSDDAHSALLVEAKRLAQSRVLGALPGEEVTRKATQKVAWRARDLRIKIRRSKRERADKRAKAALTAEPLPTPEATPFEQSQGAVQ